MNAKGIYPPRYVQEEMARNKAEVENFKKSNPEQDKTDLWRDFWKDMQEEAMACYNCRDTECFDHPQFNGDEINLNSALGNQVDGSHYSSMKIQPMEFALANGLNAAEFNVLKYISRHRDKNGVQDLLKAKHCIDLLLELEYGV